LGFTFWVAYYNPRSMEIFNRQGEIKKFPDCEFRELKDEEWFKDIVIAALDDTPAIFPVDTYPYPDWEEDMEGYPKEYDIQDFNPEDFEKVEK
jgi:hypothetical protein